MNLVKKIKMYCCFPYKKKKKQNQNEEKQIVEAEIVEAEIVEAEIVEAYIEKHKIMVHPEYIYKMFIDDCILSNNLIELKKFKQKYDIIGYLKANEKTEQNFKHVIYMAIIKNKINKDVTEELIFYHNKNEVNEYMFDIFVLYFLTYSKECKWLKDYVKPIIFEHCSCSISIHDDNVYADPIKNNE